MGFPLLKYRDIPLPSWQRSRRHWTTTYEGKYLQNLGLKILLAGLYVLFNLAIVIIVIIPPYTNANGSQREIKGSYYIASVSALLGFGALYYLAAYNPWWSVMRLGGVEPHR